MSELRDSIEDILGVSFASDQDLIKSVSDLSDENADLLAGREIAATAITEAAATISRLQADKERLEGALRKAGEVLLDPSPGFDASVTDPTLAQIEAALQGGDDGKGEGVGPLALPPHVPGAPSAPTETDFERVVLWALANSSEEYCPYFRTLAAETGLSIAAIRTATRGLASKGLAKYVRGLFTEDGLVAGSGYHITDAGREALLSGGALEAPRQTAGQSNGLTPNLPPKGTPND